MKDLKNKKIFKNFDVVETKVDANQSRTLVVKISTPNVDRSRDTVQPKGMNAENFLKNPVVLFAHNYADLPIAKCVGLKVQETGIIATVQFPDEGIYDKADTVYKLYKSGFLNAWSIGFMPTDYDENDQGGMDFKEWELFEFSSVPVPDNPEALTIMRSKGIDVDAVIGKGVIGYKETPKAAEDTAWDAGEEVKAASIDDLKAMCAWVDSENADNKGAYKLPHHLHDGEHAVVWRGVAAAMGALLGARGGVEIPDGDRKGVYNHLAKHYAQFDKEAPDFKEYDEETIAKIEAGEFTIEKDADDPADNTPITDLNVGQLKDLLADAVNGDNQDDEHADGKGIKTAVKKDVNEVIALSYVLDELHYFIRAFQQNGVSEDSITKLQQALALIMEVCQMQAVLGEKTIQLKDLTVKTGRTISAKHEQMLQDAHDHMGEAMKGVKAVLETVGNEDDGATDDESEDNKNLTPSVVKRLSKSLKNTDKDVGLTLRLLKQISHQDKKSDGERS